MGGTDPDPVQPRRVAKKVSSAEATASVFNTGFKWAGLVGIAYFAYKSIEALAGTTTVADLICGHRSPVNWTFRPTAPCTSIGRELTASFNVI